MKPVSNEHLLPIAVILCFAACTVIDLLDSVPIRDNIGHISFPNVLSGSIFQYPIDKV